MKFNKIKSYFGVVVAAFALGLTSTSCVSDLDVENINPQQTTELDTDGLFNKIYASFVLTGQQGPSDKGDIADMDEGRSQYTRMLWNLNELTTDEAHWYWYKNDGYEYIEKHTYGASDVVSTGIYYRIYFTITLCNYYLDQVPDDGTTDSETAHRRAEVRFIRAWNYYSIMDLFGNGCFVNTYDGQKGQYYTRQQFYDYIESELMDIQPSLMAAGENTYGRVDIVADWLLLSRLYLNAEVYTGKAQWAAAKEYARKVLEDQTYYQLCTQGTTNPATGEKYSAYQMLFLADNDVNGAEKENIFPVMNDGIQTKSYGSMSSLILGAYSSNMSAAVPSGTSNSWGKCYTIKGKLTSIFGLTDESLGIEKISEMTKKAKDDRALFYAGTDDVSSRTITSLDDQTQGYGCVKFRNVRSDGEATSTTDAFVDTDQPLMRIAEAYLNYAEAEYRMGGDLSVVAAKINALRDRAEATPVSVADLSEGTLCDEWAKEFWCEGRRRMDLVRFNRFGGQSTYKWEFMGGDADGKLFAAWRNIFGIPTADITNNSNLHQNYGY